MISASDVKHPGSRASYLTFENTTVFLRASILPFQSAKITRSIPKISEVIHACLYRKNL